MAMKGSALILSKEISLDRQRQAIRLEEHISWEHSILQSADIFF